MPENDFPMKRALENEPIEQVAARYIIELTSPKKGGRRLKLQAIKAHLVNRVGEEEAERLLDHASHSLELLALGTIPDDVL